MVIFETSRKAKNNEFMLRSMLEERSTENVTTNRVSE